ncbi:MAG: hypothetical protein RIR51_171, partial [Bacteroidota bacterium]
PEIKEEKQSKEEEDDGIEFVIKNPKNNSQLDLF